VPGIAVFGYASLVDSGSAARTLGHAVAPVPARLPGWRRRWSQARDNLHSEKTFAGAGDGSLPAFVLGLNLEREEREASGPNGVLIEASEEELARLDLREMRYDRVDVTAQIEPMPAGGAPAFDQVVTYVAKPAHHAPVPPDGAVILSSYIAAVETAFAALGEDQLNTYHETTETPPVEILEAVLVRDRIPPGNPRDW
jgi:cation transport regulator ChaC